MRRFHSARIDRRFNSARSIDIFRPSLGLSHRKLVIRQFMCIIVRFCVGAPPPYLLDATPSDQEPADRTDIVVETRAAVGCFSYHDT